MKSHVAKGRVTFKHIGCLSFAAIDLAVKKKKKRKEKKKAVFFIFYFSSFDLASFLSFQF